MKKQSHSSSEDFVLHDGSVVLMCLVVLGCEPLSVSALSQLRQWGKEGQRSGPAKPLAGAAGRLQSSPIHFHSGFHSACFRSDCAPVTL